MLVENQRHVILWPSKSSEVFSCSLPPTSKQKVISHPSPDAKALSISLKTLPSGKQYHSHGSEHTSNYPCRSPLIIWNDRTLGKKNNNNERAVLPCQSWVTVVVMKRMEKRSRLSLVRSSVNFSGFCKDEHRMFCGSQRGWDKAAEARQTLRQLLTSAPATNRTLDPVGEDQTALVIIRKSILISWWAPEHLGKWEENIKLIRTDVTRAVNMSSLM